MLDNKNELCGRVVRLQRLQFIIFYDKAGKCTIEIMVIIKRPLVPKQEAAAYDLTPDSGHLEHSTLYPEEAHHASA
jgi:hypothetical protein